MEIQVRQAPAAGFEADALVVPVLRGDAPGGTAARVDGELGGPLADAMTRGEFSGKAAELISFPGGGLPARRVYFVGLGEAGEVTADTLRRAAGKAARAVNGARFASLAFAPVDDAAPFAGVPVREAAEALAEALVLGLYRFIDYKTEEDAKKPDTLARATLLLPEGADTESAEAGVRYAATVARGVRLSMDLANHPSAVVTPTRMAEEARHLGRELNLTVEVLDRERMVELKMGGMIGVSQGSEEPPKFIVVDYKGADTPPVVLVGKTITFDSGGISIKPSAGMEEMKGDMSGGAAVLGTLQAVAELRLPIRVIGILTAAENMPSGTAINPGDVLTMHNGLTVEVINTDAEGRLVLADGLSYARQYGPRCIVDIATLTGACVVALGHHAIGMLGTDEDGKKLFAEVGRATGERVWELPLWDEYRDDLKSDIADLKNTGGRAGGTITAACFLSRFTGDFPWVHLDIASTAWSDKASDYLPKGSRGIGVRLMTGFLRRLAEQG